MATVPRRLSVIVSADVVGYNRLAGADEAGTSAALKKHREAIDPIFLEDGGRIVKSSGDGLLLEFPSAFSAFHASLGVQRLMAERNRDVPPDRRLVFRMGMHLGDVMAADEDASGDGIDIAERLHEIADPGGICLSRAAHAAVHKDFDSLFPDGGTKALKDIDAPVHVYNLAPEAAMLTDVPAVTAPRQLLSLIVLPFSNSAGEARHDFLADSITDQLTSELARIEDSFVVDRKTALAAAAFDDDLGALGQRLGIRYVVKGGVSVGAAGLRIDAALIDAETGATVWSDHLDIAAGDPFVMQHDASARLVPLVYTRLLTATGHMPLLASAPEFRPAPAARPLSFVPPTIREATPPAAVHVSGPTTIESRPTAEAPPAKAAPETDPLAALLVRWPVLRRPPPRRPVELARLAKHPPAPDIAAPEPPPVPAVVIHPRIELVPGRTVGRVITLRPTQPASGPYVAKIAEMPIPPRSDRPEWRIPVLLRLFFATIVAAVGGGIAITALGFEHDTVIEIACWILIALGLAEVLSVGTESIQSVNLSRPRAAEWPIAEQPPGPKRLRVGIISVRSVLRSPRGISRSTRYAP
jgi:class 3 adenylate cyclase